MLKSMTGFGRVEKNIGTKTFIIDIKSLNGKQFDLNLRIPAFLKPLEFEIRKILSTHLLRGSIECAVNLKDTGDAKPVTINTDLAKAYHKPLAALATELQLDTTSILSTLIKLPEVITPITDTLNHAEWSELQTALQEAIRNLDTHRTDEGKVLEDDLQLHIGNILQLQEQVKKLEPLRKEKIKDNLIKLLEENVGKENYDANRMEQELIFYIEKIDISEEQIRLANHCEYFKVVLNSDDDSKGKKLSFILQEIGREINTTGSKAYDASIQQLIITMKDELEKAKEQILNVL